jgi:hypothetical protein
LHHYNLVLAPLNREEEWAMYAPGAAPPLEGGLRAMPGWGCIKPLTPPTLA